MSDTADLSVAHPMWRPSEAQIEKTNLRAFMTHLGETCGADLADYPGLHAWSVANIETFWSEVWDFCGVVGEKGARVLENPAAMPGAQFFPDARLNFAENLLKTTGNQPAIRFNMEGETRDTLSWDALREEVRKLSAALHRFGVGPGDRVAAYMPNCPETVIAMLAAASLGATFSSCSPDFGVRGVLDRFGQIEPKVLIAADGARYNGKPLPQGDKLKEIVADLPTLTHVLVVPVLGDGKGDLPRALDWTEVLADAPGRPLTFERLPFSHPLFIMFSSGTTGAPKCIVHSAGGTLLQQMKEYTFNCDLKPGETLFYYTTCGWMMWNWLVGSLSVGATLALYDGSPFAPTPDVLFDYADRAGINVMGVSAKFIDSLRNEGLVPKDRHDLGSVRMMLSTGSPLLPDGYNYVYSKVKSDLALCSISGGTDILSCFVLGNPIGPIWKGEIQAKGLGMAVEVWDETGTPVTGEKGELVCTKPFPSMPVGFWNDMDGVRYRAAYFERFPGVWCHGDFAEETAHGGMIIHGRSDATLNPGGVRIGTAEIYAQVERLPEVAEALAIGQEWDGDVRVVLFVVMAPGESLTPELEARLKKQIREGASPRHVPARIVAVADLPRTKSGKITELAVRDVVHGRPVKNKEALANPDALEQFAARPELQA